MTAELNRATTLSFFENKGLDVACQICEELLGDEDWFWYNTDFGTNIVIENHVHAVSVIERLKTLSIDAEIF